MVLRTREGIATVNLTSLGKSPPESELVLADASPIAAAWRTREAYFFARSENALNAVHLDPKEVRAVVKLPPQARGAQFAINCDGKWILFSGNFHSPRDNRGRALTHTYAVEIAQSAGNPASSR